MEQQIGVVGFECEDITIYLARILSLLGKRIAIVDRTEREMLCEILGLYFQNGEDVKERDYCGIWITNRNICTEEFDVVFNVFGYRLEHPKLQECETLLMITDGLPAHASLLSQTCCKECNRFLLIRDLVPMKHTAGYLAELAGSKTEYSVLVYDEKDIRVKCGLNGYGGISIRRLSAGMKKSLAELLDFLSNDYSSKEIREAIKKV